MGRNEAGNAAARSAKAKTVSVFGHPVPMWAVKTLAILLAVEMAFGAWPSALANTLAFAEDDQEQVETTDAVGQEETQADAQEPVAEESAPIAEIEETSSDSVVSYAGALSASSSNYNVRVEFGAEAQVPNGAYLTVTELSPMSGAYQEAYDAVAASSDMGFEAIDISIHKEDGTIIEPAASVNVSILRNSLPEGAAAQSGMTVTHIDESTGSAVAQTVAGDNVAGDVVVTEDAVKADFTVGSFSTFTLTWEGGSATIHYGTLVGDQFTEFASEKVANLDTTAASISLANNFDGYSLIGAEYQASGSSDSVDIANNLTKTADGWEMTQRIHNDDETITTRTAIVENGSDIFVIYGEKKTNPSSEGEDFDGPTTTKTVNDNGDGTYTITLDVSAPMNQEITQTGANVLLVLDTTYSMASSMTGATNRFEAARSAALTLIDTLDCGTNDIDLSLVEFNSVGSIVYNWTKDYTTFRNYMANTAQHANGPTGTNWESGLFYARQVLNSKDGDNTYVIFLTDGEPNRRGTTTSTNAGTSTAISYALTQAQAITGTANTSLYGVFCGSATGYNNLNNMINDARGVKTINGTDSTTLKNEFESIAQTIVDNLGSSNVSVDDGVTSLSSVSAEVSGQASGYEYYKKGPGDSDFTKWNDAPGASFSDDNGVTWDLSSVGTLAQDTTYRIKFDVWPSQEALDLVADLNNRLKSYDSLDEATKSQIKDNGNGTYSLLTNTHLNTTYTYKGTTYTDAGDKGDGAMELQVEHFKVHKEWENDLDSRLPNEVTLYVTKDNQNYLAGDNAVHLTKNGGWTSGNLFISCGFIQKANDGSYVVKEEGHDYTVTEPVDYSYYWDLTADVYRPMEINGLATMLILDDEVTGTDGEDYYVIEGHKYKVSDQDEIVLEAKNDRRSYLNVSKTVTEYDGSAVESDDATFDFTFNVVNAKASTGSAGDPNSDYYVWFSIYDTKAKQNVKTATVGNATLSEDEATGDYYYYAASGSDITVQMKDGWNLRFTNLPVGSSYTVYEAEPTGAYEFVSAQATADNEGTPAVVTDSRAVGTIDLSNNDYTVAYTNRKTVVDLTVEKHITGSMADMTKKFTFTAKDSNGTDLIDSFKLGDNEKKIITAVPAGTTVTVTETDADGYVTTYAVTAGGTTTGGDATVATTTLQGDTTISFTNTKDTIVITGIKKAVKSPITHILVIAVLVATASVAITRSRREQWTE